MPETDFKYDVFISYTSANKEWVRKIFVPALEKTGLKCCDYYRDFDVGAPIVKEMENAVLESRKTILVLSPAYLERAWTEFENLMLQTLDPANQERRLLPVIIEKCDLPLRFRYMNCANFDHPDDIEIEWQRLFKALGIHEKSTPSTSTPDTGSRETWHLAHPYPMPPNFTGRAAELKMLDDWLANNTNRLFILRALGGFGKSALAWQWINTHVNPAEWTKLVWWSFYEGDASFEHFIEETLKYLKLEVPQGQRPQVDELLKAMQGGKIILIMDGFERALRAYSSMNAAYQGDDEPKLEDSQYDCVNINAQIFLQKVCSLPNMTSKVLMTTRLAPRAVKTHDEFLQGCIEKELREMDKADAVAFFHAQGIKGNRTEIETACAPYGYHPLSLRLLAGRILKDFDNPADIVVAQRIKIDGDIIQQQHHVLEVSYNNLPQHEQKLLSTIACFRSPVEYKTLEAIAKDVGATRESPLQDDLHDLVERGLLHFDDKNKKFDLHPIVRRYAYERLTKPDRTAAHNHLINYFEVVPEPEKIEKLEDLAPVIELYHHMVRAGKGKEALMLFKDRFGRAIHYQFGNYELEIELLGSLFNDNKFKEAKLNDESDIGFSLNQLANAYAASGQPYRAVPPYKDAIVLWKKADDKLNLVVGLDNVAKPQLDIGALKEAEQNLRHQIDLCRQIEDEGGEAIGHLDLGYVLFYRGMWQKTEQELVLSQKVFDKHGVTNTNFVSIVRAYRSRLLVSMRKFGDAVKLANEALGLATAQNRSVFGGKRDIIRVHLFLGTAYRMNGDLGKAEEYLSKAIDMCRQINMVDHEANILLDLACLRYDQKNYQEAKSLAEEAKLITERCGYVLQGADVNLFLAQYALEQEHDKAKAKQYAEEGKKLATCDGPPYYYKVAYEEAERFLENLKQQPNSVG